MKLRSWRKFARVVSTHLCMMTNLIGALAISALSFAACNKSFSWSPGSTTPSSSSSSPSPTGGSVSSTNPTTAATAAPLAPSSGADASPGKSCKLTETKLPTTQRKIGEYLAVADFSGDGKDDVAIAEQGGSIEVFLNKGDGTFAAPTLYPSPDPGAWEGIVIVAGDIDGDGHPDIVAGYRHDFSPKLNLLVLLNKGNGTFSQPGQVKVGASYFDNLRLADINGDHKLDLVADALPTDGSNGMYAFLNKGGGKFGPPVEMKLAGRDLANYELAYRDRFAWELRDVDGDGIPELVVPPRGIVSLVGERDASTGNAGNYGVCVVKVDKKAQLAAPACYSDIKSRSEAEEGYEPAQVALADFNGDGKADLVAGPATGTFVHEPFSVFINKGNGTFKDKVFTRRGNLNTFDALTARDVTGDGKADIVAFGTPNGASNYEVEIMVGKGDGTFSAVYDAPLPDNLDNPNAPAVAFGDFLGGGTVGVAVYVYEGPQSFVHIFTGRCGR